MDIIAILQWLVPSGCLGGIAVWITNKTIRNTRANKEVHDTYKTMYEDIQGTLIEQQNEIKELYKAVRALNRTLQKAMHCKHYAQCPLRDELQKSEAGINTQPKSGQYHKARKVRADPGTDTAKRSETDIIGR